MVCQIFPLNIILYNEQNLGYTDNELQKEIFRLSDVTIIKESLLSVMYSDFRIGLARLLCIFFRLPVQSIHYTELNRTTTLKQLEENIGIDTVKHLWIRHCTQSLNQDKIDSPRYVIKQPEDRGFIQLLLNEILWPMLCERSD